MVKKLKAVSSMFIFIMLFLSFSFCSDAGWIGPGSYQSMVYGPRISLSASDSVTGWTADTSQVKNTLTTHYIKMTNSTAYPPTNIQFGSSTDTNYIYTYELNSLSPKSYNNEYATYHGVYSVFYSFPIGSLNNSQPYTLTDEYDMLRFYIPGLNAFFNQTYDYTGGGSASFTQKVKQFSLIFNGNLYDIGPAGNHNIYLRKPTLGNYSFVNDIIFLKVEVEFDLTLDASNYSHSSLVSVTPTVEVSYGNNNGSLYLLGVKSIDVSSIDITNQTNSLEYGYDKSNTMNDNTNLNEHLDAMDQAEDNITNQGFTNIDNVSMVDVSSSPAMMLTAISFCSSFLQSLFINIGVFSYWVLISLSMTLALIIIGWMRFK